MYIVFNLITCNYPFTSYLALNALYFDTSFFNFSIFFMTRIRKLRIYTGTALDTVALVVESIALQPSITCHGI